MTRIAVLVSGNGSNLQALLDSDVRPLIDLVVSNKAGVKALKRADAAGCPSHVMLRSEFAGRTEFDRALAELLAKSKIDLVVLAGWMHILGPEYLSRAPRTINLQPALPGRYPGLNAIERAWRDQPEQSGCMVHEVITEVDAGAVLGVERLSLSDYSDLSGFEDAMHRAEHRLLVRVVQELLCADLK